MTACTDDERRRVAERLRGCRGGWSSGECYYTIINALGWPDRSREMGGHALYAALADLIDPDCEEDRYGGLRTVRAVDREALLALADEMDKDGRLQRERQKSGKRWFIDGLDVREYARRIREALGVVA